MTFLEITLSNRSMLLIGAATAILVVLILYIRAKRISKNKLKK
ncbi:hypothetical protein SHK09_03380 [Polaribacter sp. PL03]|nr:hypothetical protein [Polaribacter sp. PL03]MDX6745822.1 hypothetical protein [Polaribacter sp. PL03]